MRSPSQQVRAVNGFAYGVIGADLHVFADRGPIYTLQPYRLDPKRDSAWLVAQPSRMLNARYAIVSFTGRGREQDELADWRDTAGSRLSAQWLHAPGGQGKTRLASVFAEQSAQANWKVISAIHGPGAIHPPPGSHDLRINDKAGVVLIIDYADRWPASHLAWLFSNALLHRHVPARLLLVARSIHGWPAIRAELDSHGADVSDRSLAPLPDDPDGRRRMFTAACDAFAGCYGLDATAIQPPGHLSQPDFGLTLAVHIAALVAVDATAHGLRPPQSMAGLTAYLLDRERQHWAELYENRIEGLEFGTPPSVMARTVFTAVLTGALSHQEGSAILTQLDLGVHAERALSDHGTCYPPPKDEAGTVLEPLYPDRLAEDFLALALPGHEISAYPPDPWTSPAPATLLNPVGSAEAPPPYTPRGVTFLAAAAARWPHVGQRHLYPLLRCDPSLAVRAGSAAMASLAELPTVPTDLLEAIAARFPAERHTDLDAGIAAVTIQLGGRKLAHAHDPLARARIRDNLVRRLTHAGLHQQALGTARDSLPDWRNLAKAHPAQHEPELAKALVNLATSLRMVGRREEALVPAREAVEIFRRHPQYELALAGAMDVLSVCWQELGRQDETVANLSNQAIEIYRRLVSINPEEYEPHLAEALNNLGVHSRNTGRLDEARALFKEAVEANRRLAKIQAEAYEPQLGRTLNGLANILTEMGQREEALRTAEEAVEVSRRLAAANPDAHAHDLGVALNTAGNCLQVLGRLDDALPLGEEAVDICRQLVAVNAEACEPTLATALSNLGWRLANVAQRHSDPAEMLNLALARTEEAVSIYRRLSAASPARFEHDLARTLNNLATQLALVDRLAEAVITGEEGVAIRRRLAVGNPAAHQARLGWDLGTLGPIFAEAGEQDVAIGLIEESIGIFRQVAPGNPTEYGAELGRMLVALAMLKEEMPDGHERAQEAIAEAINILGPVIDKRPAVGPYLSLARQVQGQIAGTERQQQRPGDDQQPPAMPALSSDGRRGADTEAEATVSFRQAALGAIVPVKAPGTHRAINVRLPGGIRNEQRVRLRGQSSRALAGGPDGDLYVTIKVRPHKVFGRAGDDVTVTVPMTRSEAAHGTQIRVPVLDGRPVTLRIPRATPDRQKFRVPGRGLRRPDGAHGNLLVSVNLIADDADVVSMRSAIIAEARM